jgi:hypothetical protein
MSWPDWLYVRGSRDRRATGRATTWPSGRQLEHDLARGHDGDAFSGALGLDPRHRDDQSIECAMAAFGRTATNGCHLGGGSPAGRSRSAAGGLAEAFMRIRQPEIAAGPDPCRIRDAVEGGNLRPARGIAEMAPGYFVERLTWRDHV